MKIKSILIAIVIAFLLTCNASAITKNQQKNNSLTDWECLRDCRDKGYTYHYCKEFCEY